MPATIFDSSGADWILLPSFQARRDGEGKWTSNASFRMQRGKWEATGRTSFLKYVPITDLSGAFDSYWAFLLLEETAVRDVPGGWVDVDCLFYGFQDDFTSDPADTVTMSLFGLRAERSILEHPLYRKEIVEDPVTGASDMISSAYAGGAQRDPFAARDEELIVVWDKLTFGPHGSSPITDENGLKWWKFIIDEGNRTYRAPTLEFVVSETKTSRLEGSDLTDFGRKDDPPYSPPTPEGADYDWLWSGLTENREGGLITLERRWELSAPGGLSFIYDYDLTKIGEE